MQLHHKPTPMVIMSHHQLHLNRHRHLRTSRPSRSFYTCAGSMAYDLNGQASCHRRHDFFAHCFFVEMVESPFSPSLTNVKYTLAFAVRSLRVLHGLFKIIFLICTCTTRPLLAFLFPFDSCDLPGFAFPRFVQSPFDPI